jgi:hypothetical protein
MAAPIDPDDPPFADDRPLFILGCVRSGTTLTRDLLRRVPGVIIPEETHFFRWSEPFRTPQSRLTLRNNAVLKTHRGLDGVPEDAFRTMLTSSRSRKELQRRYVTACAQAKGISGPYRWCDKTPQNVYGAALIVQDMPKAKLLHVVRNPLNVVASLKLGRQLKVADIHAACNYWCEAVMIMRTIHRAYPGRVMDLRYETLIADVPATMAGILEFADLPASPGVFSRKDAHEERHLWRSALDAEDLRRIIRRCGGLARHFGYDLIADTGLDPAQS